MSQPKKTSYSFSSPGSPPTLCPSPRIAWYSMFMPNELTNFVSRSKETIYPVSRAKETNCFVF